MKYIYDVHKAVCMYTKYGNLDLCLRNWERMNAKLKKLIEIPNKLFLMRAIQKLFKLLTISLSLFVVSIFLNWVILFYQYNDLEDCLTL